MNTYSLNLDSNGDINVENSHLYYPVELEDKINLLANETITKQAGPCLPVLLGNFINSFVIKKEKIQVFYDKVLPFIGNKIIDGIPVEIWRVEEECEANLI